MAEEGLNVSNLVKQPKTTYQNSAIPSSQAASSRLLQPATSRYGYFAKMILVYAKIILVYTEFTLGYTKIIWGYTKIILGYPKINLGYAKM